MKAPLPIEEARPIVDRLVERFTPVCERVEVAGSVRREKPMVGDLEVVVIPKGEQLNDLLADWMDQGIIRHRPDKKWGEKYKSFHIRAWLEARRVLKPDGVFVLNCKDHIRRGERVAVCAWHKDALTGMGFRLVEEVAVPCPSNRFGQNGGCRVSDEMVMKFERVIF